GRPHLRHGPWRGPAFRPGKRSRPARHQAASDGVEGGVRMTQQPAAERSAAPPAMQRSRGTGRLGTTVRDGRTRLDTLYQEGCCKLRLPRAHGVALEAVLINTSGGLAGGDAVAWEMEAAPGARVALTTQACERA